MKLLRQNVIDVFLDKLQQITILNGYSTDAGSNVKYSTDIEEQPNNDCVAVFDGVEKITNTNRINRFRTRELQLYISIAFVGNNPRTRANAGCEDVLTFLDKNPSMGQTNLKIEIIGFDIAQDDLGELAELIAELKITY